MSRDDLLQFLRQKPFVPFRIQVSDGTEFDVRHPELVLVDRTKAMIFFPAPDQPPPAFERFEVVALLHITRLVPLESAAA
jgi:hypothetical protein